MPTVPHNWTTKKPAPGEKSEKRIVKLPPPVKTPKPPRVLSANLP